MLLFRSMARDRKPFSNQTRCQAGVRSCSYPLCNFLYCTAHTCLFEAVCRTSGKLFDRSRFRAKWKVRRLFIRELLYVDDAAFVATSTSTHQNLCSSFASTCAEFHTTISLSKTVVLSQGPCSYTHISIDKAELHSVDEFCYLGSTVDNTNSMNRSLTFA